MDEQQQDEFANDLRQEQFAGRNVAGQSVDAVRSEAVATAFDLKDIHDRFKALSDAELKAIPIVPEGTRLQHGTVYVDLLGEHTEFKVTGEMMAGPDNAYAPKDAVDYQIWNRLIGVTDAEQTGQTT